MGRNKRHLKKNRDHMSCLGKGVKKTLLPPFVEGKHVQIPVKIEFGSAPKVTSQGSDKLNSFAVRAASMFLLVER
jgi:hypothetical protein